MNLQRNRTASELGLLDKQVKKKLKERLNQDPEVLALYLYGSRSSGKSHSRSDTDIGVLLNSKVKKAEYKNSRMDFMVELSEFFPGKLDLIILNQVTPLLQFQVLKNGTLLYDPDPDIRALSEVKMLNQYYLSKKFYDFHFENLLNRIKEKGLGHGQERNRSAAEEVRRISEKLAKISGPQPG